MSRKKKKGNDLRKELKEMEKNGILLRMNGRLSSSGKIAKAHMVAENGSYMRDYIPGQEGGIAEIDFCYVEKNR